MSRLHPTKFVVSVSGNLAAGKTTLCKRLEAILKENGESRFRVLYERFEKIETLPKFYGHLKKKGFVYNPYSLETQLAFLEDRTEQLSQALSDPGCDLIIEDRSIYEFAQVFAKAHASMGLMSPPEYNIYKERLGKLQYLPFPDLLLYLSRPTSSVVSRDRSIERGLAEKYLDELNINLQNFTTRMAAQKIDVYDPPKHMLDSDYFITDAGCQSLINSIVKKNGSKIQNNEAK